MARVHHRLINRLDVDFRPAAHHPRSVSPHDIDEPALAVLLDRLATQRKLPVSNLGMSHEPCFRPIHPLPILNKSSRAGADLNSAQHPGRGGI